jgi:ribosome maturation factor RimP
MTTLQADIERRLAATEPEVEVLLAEVVGGRRLRVFIDHPQGVTIGLCERVSVSLNELRERYSLEVSSPGLERPLTKPAHFRRFLGRRVRVRTRTPTSRIAAPSPAPGSRAASRARRDAPAGQARTGGSGAGEARTVRSGAGQARAGAPGAGETQAGDTVRGRAGAAKSFTGELVGASEREVTLAADGGVVTIPYNEIRRSNLVEE